MRAALAYGTLAVAGTILAACGPVPVEVAERQCLEQVRPKAPISGEAGMGVTSGGNFRSRVKVDFNLGVGGNTDPAAAFDACVYQRSGRMPTRPLYARTDWKG